ncbi:facilitated trehalose transporter Tret1-like [Athalia rosae]|uniref:facilitated trehalose transporter Tret1-like n=1 Tax=Athalia rosae TaxID=37344 RepID=UPI000DE7F6E9|nr:facilitated trehalose transporter Tret1-like [Athalia rosae]
MQEYGGSAAETATLNSERLNRDGRKFFQYVTTIIVGLTFLQTGITLGWTSPVLPYLMSEESFISVTSEQSSWIGSLLQIGAMAGATPAGKISDVIGRRPAILMFSILFLVSWSLLIFGNSLWYVYLARFLGGVGSGAISVSATMYIGEIAEPSVRGGLASFFGIFMATGNVLAYGIGAYLSYTSFAISGAALILLFFILSPFLTESPVWLVQQGRYEEAKKPLLILRGTHYDIGAEIALLQEQLTVRKSRNGNSMDLLGTVRGRKALMVASGLMVFQQFSGIDAVVSYTVTIFQLAGSTIDPFTATIMVGLTEVSMAVLGSRIIDRFGRRPLLIISGLGIATCFVSLGYYFRLKSSGDDVSSIGWIPLASLSLYVIAYAIGYGMVPYVMYGELFPVETKGVASSFSVVINWLLAATVTKLFPSMISNVGEAGTFFSFGIMMMLATLFAIVAVPETRGKSLQQIQDELSGEKESIPLRMMNGVQQ